MKGPLVRHSTGNNRKGRVERKRRCRCGGQKGPAVVTENQCRYKGVLFRFFLHSGDFLTVTVLYLLNLVGGRMDSSQESTLRETAICT